MNIMDVVVLKVVVALLWFHSHRAEVALSHCSVVKATIDTTVNLSFTTSFCSADSKNWVVNSGGQDCAACRNGKPISEPGFQILTLCSSPDPVIMIQSVQPEHFGKYVLQEKGKSCSCLELVELNPNETGSTKTGSTVSDAPSVATISFLLVVVGAVVAVGAVGTVVGRWIYWRQRRKSTN